MKKLIILLISFASISFFSVASADTTIHLDVVTSTGSLYNQDITVAPCDSDNAGTMAVTAYCAVLQSGLANDWSWFGSDAFLNSIDTKVNNDNNNGIYWGWFANLELGQTALNKYVLMEGDSILINYDINPLKIAVDNTNPSVGSSIKFTVMSFGFDSSWNPAWSPVVGGKIVIGPDTLDLDLDGTYSFIVIDTTPLIVKGQAIGFLETKELVITPTVSLDVTAPIITLIGDTTESINVGSDYIEKGATATDDIDGDITSKIVITGNVDTSKVGSYDILFDVSDLLGNKANTVTRTVNVINSGGGGGGPTLSTLSIPQATLFLANNQDINGSFIDSLYTDWVAIAVGSLGSSGDIMKAKISEYMKMNPLMSSVITDNERRAMALMSLGINPYSGTSVDYINKIVSSYDGTQFGDNTLFNDDIFALIVLQKAGYISTDTMIVKDIEYILSYQSPDGSWGSIDMTGAALQALSNFTDIAGVQSSILKGENYLISTQQVDGGFYNSSSTSWALQALSSNPSFSSGVARADDYLAKLQQADGGVELSTSIIENRIWATAYAIPAALHKTWSNILQSFPKPIISTGGGGTSTILIPEVESLTQKLVKEEEKIDEKKIEELEVINKDSLIKPKLKNTQKVTKPKVVAKANPVPNTSNVLVANASSSLEAETPSRSFFSRIVGTIKVPFIWLWDKLGF
ncbi:MAG: immunoglobulin-like domain-containing protein [Patescibacteria group bacterium]